MIIFLQFETNHTTYLAGNALVPSAGWTVIEHTALLVPET